MKLEKLSALAELVSAAAIVITLVYLSIQTHQNTAATEAMVRQSILDADQRLLQNFIDYPFLNDAEASTREQQTQLSALLVEFIRTRENQWLQYQNGALDRATWESYRRPMQTVVFSSAYGRALWADAIQRNAYAEGFTEDIEQWRTGLTPLDRDSILYLPEQKE